MSDPTQPLHLKIMAASFEGNFIGTPTELATCLQDLAIVLAEPTNKIVYLDLEGQNLFRHGTISLLTLVVHYHTPKISQIPYIIDIHTLGVTAFDTRSNTSPPVALRSILQSTSITKYLFDLRSDSDAMNAHFGVRMRKVMDLQLMENAARVPRQSFRRTLDYGYRDYLFGLDRCITEDAYLTLAQKTAESKIKANVKKLYSPEQGGTYAVFEERPLRRELVEYCVQDVLFLGLWEVYRGRLRFESGLGGWEQRVALESEKRVVQNVGRDYKSHGPEKRLAPSW